MLLVRRWSIDNETSDLVIKDIIEQLSLLGCKYLEFRIFGRVDLLFLKESFINYSNTPIQQIIVHLESNSENLMFYLSDIISNQRISDFYIYCLDKDKIKPIQDNIHFINRPLSNDNCGHISKAGFTCNLKTFSEAQKFNTCLYKKISFGRKGEIKSCPSLPTSFGNVQRETHFHSLGILPQADLSCRCELFQWNLFFCEDVFFNSKWNSTFSKLEISNRINVQK